MQFPNQTKISAHISGSTGRSPSYHGISDFIDSAKEISDKLISLNHAYSLAQNEPSEESLVHIEECVKELSEAHSSYQNLALHIEEAINETSRQGDLALSRAMLIELSAISNLVKNQIGGIDDQTPIITTTPTNQTSYIGHTSNTSNTKSISHMITCFRLNSDTFHTRTMNPGNGANNGAQQYYGPQPDWVAINNLTASTTPQIVHAELQSMKGVLKKDFNTLGSTMNSVIQTQVNTHAQFREQLRTLKTNQDRILIILEEEKPGRYGELANPQGNTVDESQTLRSSKISAKIELMKTKSLDKHCFWWSSKADVEQLWPGNEYETNDLNERCARAIAQDSLKIEIAKIPANIWEKHRGNPETCGYNVIDEWFSRIARFKEWEVAKIMPAVRFIIPSGNRYGIPMPERMTIGIGDYEVYDFIIQNGGRVSQKKLGMPGYHMKIHVRDELKEFYEDLFAFKIGMQNNNSWTMWPRYDGPRTEQGDLTGRKDKISMHYKDHKKNDGKIYVWATDLITQRDMWNDSARAKYVPNSLAFKKNEESL